MTLSEIFVRGLQTRTPDENLEVLEHLKKTVIDVGGMGARCEERKE